jgi:serine/threonine protein kinase
MISTHNVSDYVNASFTSGKLLCISFERNEGTLDEILSNTSVRDEIGWLSKCQVILKKVAQCLQHLHENSAVHGRLEMNTIAQFGRSEWKLLDIGGSTKMGDGMRGLLLKCVPPESLSGVRTTSTTPETSSRRSRSKSRSRLMKWKGDTVKSNSVTSMVRSGKDLPPLPNSKANTTRKKFGIFVFGLKDLGLGSYGAKGRSRSMTGGPGIAGTNHDFNDGGSSMDSSMASSAPEGSSVTTDEASARVIAMQEDEIARLRKALEEKEHIYRHQLAEERASFKRQAVQRQRQLQHKRAQELSKIELPRFAPEKVMASPLWDVWSFGLIMAEAIIGKSPLLPSSADSEAEFLDKLSKFNDVQLSVVCEEVNECGGQLGADLVARLLHPKPQQRIASMEMALKHKYFHEQVVEISPDKKRRGRNAISKDSKTPRGGRRSLSLRRSQRRSLSQRRK